MQQQKTGYLIQPIKVDGFCQSSQNIGTEDAFGVKSMPRKSMTVFARMIVMLFAPILLQTAIPAANLPWTPFYSQRDSKWSNDRMGVNGPRIGTTGCAMTSLTMLLRSTCAEVDPKRLNAFLVANNGYLSGGVIRWDVGTAFDGPRGLVFSSFGTLPTSPLSLKAAIDSGQRIICASQRFADHWVILVGYKNAGTKWSDFLYGDPIDTTATAHYVGDGWVKPGAAARVFRYQ